MEGRAASGCTYAPSGLAGRAGGRTDGATDEHEVEPQLTEHVHMPQERPSVELEAIAAQAAEAEAAEAQAWQAWTRQLQLERLEVAEHRRSPQLHVVPVDACAAPRGC